MRALSQPAPNAEGTALKDIALTLRAGEILGIAASPGNGQEELAALSGEVRSAPGTVTLEGADLSAAGPEPRRVKGLLSAPEDRLGHAAVPDFRPDREHPADRGQPQVPGPRRLIDHRAARDYALAVIDGFDVRTPGPMSRPAPCPAATCRSSSSAERSCRTRACWS